MKQRTKDAIGAIVFTVTALTAFVACVAFVSYLVGLWR